MNKKVFVVGSNSFSGAHFVDVALRHGYQVFGCGRSTEIAPLFRAYHDNQQLQHFHFHQFDVNHHRKEMIQLINDEQIPYVVNFACQGMVAESWLYVEDYFRTNALSTVLLHEELRKVAHLKKYVHISTPEVYGTCDGLIKEHSNYQPSTPYAVSRAAADMSLMSFFKAYGFPVVFTRAANVYGPYQQLYRIIPRTILFFLLGRKLTLHGGGVSVRSFIHIQDTMEGTLKIMEEGVAGEMYHQSTTQNISIRALVEKIAHTMGVEFNQLVEVGPERLGKDSAYLLDSNKLLNMGWLPTTSLDEGIQQTLSWIQSNLDEIKKLPFDYIHKP